MPGPPSKGSGQRAQPPGKPQAVPADLHGAAVAWAPRGGPLHPQADDTLLDLFWSLAMDPRRAVLSLFSHRLHLAMT